MKHAIFFSEQWNYACDTLARGKSKLIIAPRYYGKSALWDYFGTLDFPRSPIYIDSRMIYQSGEINYNLLWDMIKNQTNTKSRKNIYGNNDLLDMLCKFFMTNENKYLIVIDTPGKNKELHYYLLSFFEDLLRNTKIGKSGYIPVCAFDDSSLSNWNKLPDYSTLYSFYPECEIPPLSKLEVTRYADYILDETPLSRFSQFKRAISEGLFDYSGGHPGIISEIAEYLLFSHIDENEFSWVNIASQHENRSSILDNINKVISEDIEGFFNTAIQYKTPKFAEKSPRVSILKQFGVINRNGAGVKLASGIIGKLIQNYGDSAKITFNTGTVIRDDGSKKFIPGNLSVEKEDFIVLHLSDLHVSSFYEHRIPNHQYNLDKRTAGDFIYDDLVKLELLGKVDAMVISGDIVWAAADIAQYYRAINVIDEILDKIKLDKSHTMIIPGNHDIVWNPSPLMNNAFIESSSRENFETFFKLFNGYSFEDIQLMSVQNLSGKHLNIIGIDSNYIESPEVHGIGFVSRESLTKLRTMLSNIKNTDKNSRVWITIHHHVFPANSITLKDAKDRNISLLANASEFLYIANEFGVEAILHGHEHQPTTTISRRWPTDGDENFMPISVIGAGSFGVNREKLGPFSRNHYYILHRKSEELIIRSRQLGENGVKFSSHADFSIPKSFLY